MVLAMFLTGCGPLHHLASTTENPVGTSPPAAAPSTLAWRTIVRGGLSLRIPRAWHLGEQVTISQSGPFSDTIEILSRFGIGTPQNNLPPYPHPYLSEQESAQHGQITFSLGETSVTGRVYELTVTAPQAQRVLVTHVVHTLKVPRPTTATMVVHQFLAHHPGSQGTASVASPVSYIRTDRGSSRWLLVYGSPATAMEFFVLFHSADGGLHWSFVNQTGLPTASSTFPGTLGMPTMLFWTPKNGLIAEATGFSSRGLLMYRTINGGHSWHVQAMGPKNQITGATSPHLTDRDGTLEVSVQLKSGRVFRAESSNGGKTWNTL